MTHRKRSLKYRVGEVRYLKTDVSERFFIITKRNYWEAHGLRVRRILTEPATIPVSILDTDISLHLLQRSRHVAPPYAFPEWVPAEFAMLVTAMENDCE